MALRHLLHPCPWIKKLSAKNTKSISKCWERSVKRKSNVNSIRVIKNSSFRSSHPEMFLGKGALKICSKFTGEQPCRSAISVKLLCNFIEIVLRHGCSPGNLLHVFRAPFLNNTSEWLLLIFWSTFSIYAVQTFLKILCWGFLVPRSESLVVSSATLLCKTWNISALSMLVYYNTNNFFSKKFLTYALPDQFSWLT